MTGNCFSVLVSGFCFGPSPSPFKDVDSSLNFCQWLSSITCCSTEQAFCCWVWTVEHVTCNIWRPLILCSQKRVAAITIDCILQIVKLSHIMGREDLFYCLKLPVFFNFSAPPPPPSNPPLLETKRCLFLLCLWGLCSLRCVGAEPLI